MINSGLLLKDDVDKVICDDNFKEMEHFSKIFLDNNKSIYQKYSLKWLSDPLHQWSRILEYPFVFENITEHYQKNEKPDFKILDAGSGFTFFPFYIKEKIQSVAMQCCDYDAKLADFFESSNSNQHNLIDFSFQDISKLSFDSDSFDVIYCISVLEHTANYEAIIKEFKRVLRLGGILIVSYDISLDNYRDISIEGAFDLQTKLERHLKPQYSQKHINLEKIKNDEILTTKYINKTHKELLPWKFPLYNAFKCFTKFKMPKMIFNLACYVQAFENNLNTVSSKD